MKKIKIFCFIILQASLLNAQEYTSSAVFAHNDYVQPIPFFTAYHQEVGYIEADLFLHENDLYVAHTRGEIEMERTLESLYLKPLQKLIAENNGQVYRDSEKRLVLMIDQKTEATATLDFLVKTMRKYPQLLSSSSLEIVISGNRPPSSDWKKYPEIIHFDGRPDASYTPDQLARVSFISASFKEHSQWNGKGVLPMAEKQKLKAIIEAAHKKGKMRFWAMPDFENAWIQLMNLEVDILNTDQVISLTEFIRDLPKNTYKHSNPYPVYTPLKSDQNEASYPKNIILMIGDGLGFTQMYSGYTANQGSLNLFNIKSIGFSITTASDSFITDSAAGATAMATGKKTNNRHIGVDSLGNDLVSITEKLKQKGFKTAVISNGDITDATPASFYAHQSERSLTEEIALDFLDSNVDILIGGGSKAFKSRKDGKDLFSELTNAGYTISESFSSIDRIKASKFVILDNAAVVSKTQGRDDFLTQAFFKSVKLFSDKSSPFFVMVEGAQIDWGGHNNDMEYMVQEVLDFDQAVGAAMKFVDDNKETLLIITADHETGGLSLLDGDLSKGYVHGHFSTNDHTAVMVPVFSYGPGAEKFQGVYQNSALHWKILEILQHGLE